MFFRTTDNSLTKLLEKEMNAFVMYSALCHLFTYFGDSPYKYVEVNGEKIYVRSHLDLVLMRSRDKFVDEAEMMIGGIIIDADREAYKKEFRDIILAENNSVEVFNVMNRPLHIFLYSLCYARAEHALNIFISKYPLAIRQLSTGEFNSLCVIAAINHLHHFMIYLCKQGRSIDEYAILDSSCFSKIMTPLIATYYRVGSVSPGRGSEMIDKAQLIIELLIENGADPGKKYIIDDYSHREIKLHLKAGDGYTMIQECTDFIARYDKLSLEDGDVEGLECSTDLDELNFSDFMRFAEYIVSLKLNPSRAFRSA